MNEVVHLEDNKVTPLACAIDTSCLSLKKISKYGDEQLNEVKIPITRTQYEKGQN